MPPLRATAPAVAVPGTLPPDAAAPSAQAAADRSLVRGLAWTGGVRWGGQILTWGSTVVVARVLSPADYGVVGMATVFTGLLTMVSEFGLGSAVVTLRGLTQEQIREINTLAAVLGVVSAALTCAAAPFISRFMASPPLTAVLTVMSMGFVMTGFRTVPDAALQKDLQFRTLALMEGAQALLMSATTLVLALAGARYWTLVAGTMVGGFLSMGMAVVRRPHGFARPRLASIRPAVSFSGRLLISRLSWFGYSNADFFVVGKALGERALGAYTLAWSLASIPIGKVSAMIMRVTPGFFAAVQDDPPALRRWLLALTEGVALLTFPMAVGLALVADDFVLLVLGAKWEAAILPLRLLAAYACVRSVAPLLPPVLSVLGDVGFFMRVDLAAALVLPVGFVAGARWGVEGVAWAWIVIHPIILLPLYVRVCRRLEMRFASYLLALWPALSGCAAMAVAETAAEISIPHGWGQAASFAAQVAAGAAGYALVVLTLHRDRVRRLRELLRR